MAISRGVGDRRTEGGILSGLGTAYLGRGRTHQAIEFLEQSLATAREIGYRQGEGASLGNLGLAYRDLGNYRRAIEFYEQHMAIAREIGDRQGEGTALLNAALAFNAVGARGEAIGRMKAAAEIFAEIESPYIEQARAWLATWQGGSG